MAEEIKCPECGKELELKKYSKGEKSAYSEQENEFFISRKFQCLNCKKFFSIIKGKLTEIEEL